MSYNPHALLKTVSAKFSPSHQTNAGLVALLMAARHQGGRAMALIQQNYAASLHSPTSVASQTLADLRKWMKSVDGLLLGITQQPPGAAISPDLRYTYALQPGPKPEWTPMYMFPFVAANRVKVRQANDNPGQPTQFLSELQDLLISTENGMRFPRKPSFIDKHGIKLAVGSLASLAGGAAAYHMLNRPKDKAKA